MAEHLLENDMSFLALELETLGQWSRDVDLQKCISRIAKRPTRVNLLYAHKSTYINETGGLSYQLDNKPINLGLYQIKGGKGSFTLKGFDQKMFQKLAEPFKSNKEYIDDWNKSNG